MIIEISNATLYGNSIDLYLVIFKDLPKVLQNTALLHTNPLIQS